MKFFQVNLISNYNNFYIQACRLVGLYKIQNLYSVFSVKVNNMAIEISDLNLLYYKLRLKKNILNHTINTLTYSSEDYKLNVYPYLNLLSLKRLQVNFHKNKLFYNYLMEYKIYKKKNIFLDYKNVFFFNFLKFLKKKLLYFLKLKKKQRNEMGFFYIDENKKFEDNQKYIENKWETLRLQLKISKTKFKRPFSVLDEQKHKIKIQNQIKKESWYKFILFKLKKLNYFKWLKRKNMFKKFKKRKKRYVLFGFFFKLYKFNKKLFFIKAK